MKMGQRLCAYAHEDDAKHQQLYHLEWTCVLIQHIASSRLAHDQLHTKVQQLEVSYNRR